MDGKAVLKITPGIRAAGDGKFEYYLELEGPYHKHVTSYGIVDDIEDARDILISLVDTAETAARKTLEKIQESFKRMEERLKEE